MKKETKNVARIILLGVVFTLLSTVVYAQIGDLFVRGLTNISNFFDDSRYRNYAVAIDFFLFTAGFTAIFLIGLQTAFGLRKEGQTEWKSTITRPLQALAIVLGLLAALLLIRQGYSSADLLPYMHWFLCVLIFFVLYKSFQKLGLQSVLINLVISLVLALLICSFLAGLVNKGPSTTFWDRFSGIDIPSPGFTGPGGGFGGPSTGIGGGTGGGPDVIIDEEGDEGSNLNYLWLLLPLLFALGGAWGLHKLARMRRERRANEPIEAAGANIDDSIEGIRDIFEDTVKAKEKVNNQLAKIVDQKRKDVNILVDRYHKALSVDPAYYQDPSHPINKKLSEESRVVADLIKNELKLEKDLQKLNELEQHLLAQGVNWTVKIVKRHWKDPEVHKKALELKKMHERTPIGFYEKLRNILENSKDKITQKDLPPQYIYYREKAISLIVMLLSDQWGTFGSVPGLKRGKAYQGNNLGRKVFDKYPENLKKELKIVVKGGYCRSVVRLIGHYFLIGEDNKKREKQWKKVTKPEVLKEFVTNKDKWKRIESSTPEAIKTHFQEEERFFMDKEAGFQVTVERQIKAMKYLIGCLKILEKLREPLKKRKTEMQPLMVRYIHKDQTGKENTVELSNVEIKTKSIPLGARIEVHTLLRTGEGPKLRLQCLVDGQPIFNPPLIVEKKEKHPKISVMISDYLSLLKGEHTIMFDLLGGTGHDEAFGGKKTPEASINKWNHDWKSIKIRVGMQNEEGVGGGGSVEDGFKPFTVCNPQEHREMSDEEIKKVYEVDLQTVMTEWLTYYKKNKDLNSFLRTFSKLEASLKRCYNGSIPGCQSYNSQEVRDIIGQEYWKGMHQFYQRAIAFRKYLLNNYDVISERLLTQLMEKAQLEVPKETLKKLRRGKLKEETITALVQAGFEKNSKVLEGEDGMLYYLWMLLYRGTYFYMGTRDYMRIARNVVHSHFGQKTDNTEDILKYKEWMERGLPEQFNPKGRMQSPTVDKLFEKKADIPDRPAAPGSSISPTKEVILPKDFRKKREEAVKKYTAFLPIEREPSGDNFREKNGIRYVENDGAFKLLEKPSEFFREYIFVPENDDSGWLFPHPLFLNSPRALEVHIIAELKDSFKFEKSDPKEVVEPAYAVVDGEKIDVVKRGKLK